MEIHAPEGPINSVKDFLVHISIVTVGILIALGLEGLRETIHNRHLVRETRETIHAEMGHDSEHAGFECSRVTAYANSLKKLTAAMPALAQGQPEVFAKQLNIDRNPGYFLVANSWEAALSTGVLAHMSTGEVADYAYAAQGIRNYTELQNQTRPAENRVKAFVAAHPRPTADQVQQESEELILFSTAEDELAYVCPQMKDDVDRAVKRSEMR